MLICLKKIYKKSVKLISNFFCNEGEAKGQNYSINSLVRLLFQLYVEISKNFNKNEEVNFYKVICKNTEDENSIECYPAAEDVSQEPASIDPTLASNLYEYLDQNMVPGLNTNQIFIILVSGILVYGFYVLLYKGVPYYQNFIEWYWMSDFKEEFYEFLYNVKNTQDHLNENIISGIKNIESKCEQEFLYIAISELKKKKLISDLDFNNLDSITIEWLDKFILNLNIEKEEEITLNLIINLRKVLSKKKEEMLYQKEFLLDSVNSFFNNIFEKYFDFISKVFFKNEFNISIVEKYDAWNQWIKINKKKIENYEGTDIDAIALNDAVLVYNIEYQKNLKVFFDFLDFEIKQCEDNLKIDWDKEIKNINKEYRKNDIDLDLSLELNVESKNFLNINFTEIVNNYNQFFFLDFSYFLSYFMEIYLYFFSLLPVVFFPLTLLYFFPLNFISFNNRTYSFIKRISSIIKRINSIIKRESYKVYNKYLKK